MLRRIRKEGLSFLAYERCQDQVERSLMVSDGAAGVSAAATKTKTDPDRVSFLRGLFAVHVFLYGL